jgi:branched-chain amino acid transport system substrate-binding protein
MRIALVGAFAAAFIGVAAAQDSKEPIKLGAIEVLTGPNNRYGLPAQRAFDLAVDEINKAGGVLGGRPLAIAYEDSAGNKDQAMNAARKLIGRDKVPLILGPTLSNEMFAVGPVVNERKIPIIGTSTTASGITAIGPWVFRTAMPESDVIPVTLKAARDRLGIKKVVVMYANDDAFTKSAYDVMKDSLAKLGVETLATETFSGKDTDFTAQLTKAKNLNPDAIVVSGHVDAASGIILQGRQLGIDKKVRFIGGNGFNSPKLAEIAGAAADGTLVGSPWFIAKKDEVNQKFVKAFHAKYGDEPDQFAAQAYDTMYLVAKAINAANGTDPEKLREALQNVKNNGVMGPFSFTEGRDPADASGVVVLEMNGGKYRIFGETS